MPTKETLFRPSPFKRPLAAFAFAEYELTYLTIRSVCLVLFFLRRELFIYTTAKYIAVLIKWPTP